MAQILVSWQPGHEYGFNKVRKTRHAAVLSYSILADIELGWL